MKIQPCPENYYSQVGNAPPGYFSANTRTKCLSCGTLLKYGPPGSDSFLKCAFLQTQECPEGQFAAAGVLCSPCPPSTYAEGSGSRFSCTFCMVETKDEDPPRTLAPVGRTSKDQCTNDAPKVTVGGCGSPKEGVTYSDAGGTVCTQMNTVLEKIEGGGFTCSDQKYGGDVQKVIEIPIQIPTLGIDVTSKITIAAKINVCDEPASISLTISESITKLSRELATVTVGSDAKTIPTGITLYNMVNLVLSGEIKQTAGAIQMNLSLDAVMNVAGSDIKLASKCAFQLDQKYDTQCEKAHNDLVCMKMDAATSLNGPKQVCVEKAVFTAKAKALAPSPSPTSPTPSSGGTPTTKEGKTVTKGDIAGPFMGALFLGIALCVAAIGAAIKMNIVTVDRGKIEEIRESLQAKVVQMKDKAGSKSSADDDGTDDGDKKAAVDMESIENGETKKRAISLEGFKNIDVGKMKGKVSGLRDKAKEKADGLKDKAKEKAGNLKNAIKSKGNDSSAATDNTADIITHENPLTDVNLNDKKGKGLDKGFSFDDAGFSGGKDKVQWYCICF